MRIKVCGMREADNIRAVEELGIDLMGFIFWPGSSRYVSHRPTHLPTKCKRVGVFVDATIDNVMSLVEEYHLDAIQLHGHEMPDYLHALRASCMDNSYNFVIIKAFNVATPEDLVATELYQDLVDCFLFDTKAERVGGNGTKFDWSVLSHYQGKTPFLLSGGIGPDDAEAVKSFHHPQCIGIDLNSRFEQVPGRKDIYKLKLFLQQI